MIYSLNIFQVLSGKNFTFNSIEVIVDNCQKCIDKLWQPMFDTNYFNVVANVLAPLLTSFHLVVKQRYYDNSIFNFRVVRLYLFSSSQTL